MKESNRNLIVGLTVLVAIVLLAVLVALFAGLPGVFQPGQEFVAYLPSAQGLRDGNAVNYAEIRVGQVTGVHLRDKSHPELGVAVRFRVDADIAITENTALVVHRGMMGPPWITLAPISDEDYAKVKPETAMVDGARVMPVFTPGGGGEPSQMDAALNSLNSISKNVDMLTENLVETSNHLTTLLITLNSAASKIDTGDGTAGLLLNDPALYREMLLVSRQLNEALLEFTNLAKQWQETGVELQVK